MSSFQLHFPHSIVDQLPPNEHSLPVNVQHLLRINATRFEVLVGVHHHEPHGSVRFTEQKSLAQLSRRDPLQQMIKADAVVRNPGPADLKRVTVSYCRTI